MRPPFAAVVIAACSALSLAAAPEPAAKPSPDGWTDLMKPDVWQKFDAGWIAAKAVAIDPANPKGNTLKADKASGGDVWVNGEKGRLPNLLTKKDYGDCEVHVEFLIAKRSNAGIKFNGVYEIQILDSFGKTKLTGDDCGGIYPRAEDKPKYHHIDDGIAPRVNAARPAGEWQTLDVVWKAPRFDAAGKKTANAVVVKAVLNGQVVHENQELKTPTGANWSKPEKPAGPFMLQADHGPTAFRNVRIKAAE